MTIKEINEKIKDTGFASLPLEAKKKKAEDIWYKRHNKEKKGKKLWGGEFEDKEKFVDWYLKQERKCAYCGVEENICKDYFYDIIEEEQKKKMTRNYTRGQILELDKIDNNSINPYNPHNCKLICYVCNNAKSNICNSREEFEPIKEGIKKFWDVVKSKK